MMMTRLTYITEELPSEVLYLDEEGAYEFTVNLPVANERGEYKQPLASFQIESPEMVNLIELWHEVIIHHAKEIEEAMNHYGFKCLRDWVDEPAPY